MTAREFCYWLQGKLEIDGDAKPLDASQVQVIKNHLNLVFLHDIDAPDPSGKLTAAHEGNPRPIPGLAGANSHLQAQTCSVCGTNWWECPHGKNQPRPRC